MKEKYSTQLRIAICDGKQADREIIAQMTEKILQREEISFSISICESIRELPAAMDEKQTFLMYLLDMTLEELFWGRCEEDRNIDS